MSPSVQSQGPISKHIIKLGEQSGVLLDAERAAATAGALDIRIVELEARSLERLDIVNRDIFKVHLAHLVDQDLKPIELVDIVRGILLIFKGHVIAETGAAATHNGNAQCDGRRILLAHNFFNF